MCHGTPDRIRNVPPSYTLKAEYTRDIKKESDRLLRGPLPRAGA